LGAPDVIDDPSANEKEPDVRFTYANERTFLAWNRTALALIATGIAATQLLPEFHVEGGRRILGLPMIALGALVAISSFRHWRANERAMRRGEPLPRSPMPLVLSIGVGAVAVIAVVLALIGSK
jgi:putative membrane protein